MKKLIYFIFICTCILFVFCFSPLNITLSDTFLISHPLLEKKMTASEINKIQITCMANPIYDNDSKIITDTEEIKNMVESFNSAEIEYKVNDFVIGGASAYYFFYNDKLINKFSFNGNDSNKIFIDNDIFYIHYYSKNTPYDIYKTSPSEIITVDDSLNIINS